MQDTYTLVNTGVIKVNDSKYCPAEHRFWFAVDKEGPIHPVLNTRCWVWTRAKNNGYGAFCDKGQVGAHKWSYRFHVGPTNGLCVCHKCDNPACVNPEHLFLATNQENTQDKVRKGRQSRVGPYRPARGEAVSLSKLTEQDVLFIRANYQRYHKEFGGTPLAKKFGVTTRVIHLVHKRRAWKHVA